LLCTFQLSASPLISAMREASPPYAKARDFIFCFLVHFEAANPENRLLGFSACGDEYQKRYLLIAFLTLNPESEIIV
jgi:hypothetical protein